MSVMSEELRESLEKNARNYERLPDRVKSSISTAKVFPRPANTTQFKVEPINPEQCRERCKPVVPDHVIEAANQLIVESFDGQRAQFLLSTLEDRALEIEPDRVAPLATRLRRLRTMRAFEIDQIFECKGWDFARETQSGDVLLTFTAPWGS